MHLAAEICPGNVPGILRPEVVLTSQSKVQNEENSVLVVEQICPDT